MAYLQKAEMNFRLLVLRLRNSRSWSAVKFVTIITYIIFMILCLLYLFKRNNPVTSTEELSNNPDEPVAQEVLDFEAQVRPGLGDYGRAVVLSDEQTDEDIKGLMKDHSFNKFVSDVISLKRDLPDTRHPTCRTIGQVSH